MEELSDKVVFEKHLEKCVEHFKQVLGKMRSGIADPNIIRNFRLDYYGSKLELYQIAQVSTPEPRLIQIKPYNKADVKTILKAIQESSLNLNPTNTEEIVRIVLAPLTTTQKQGLKKDVKKEAEKARIALRNVRRKAMDEINKDEELSDSQKKQQKNDLQNLVNKYNKNIDVLVNKKFEKIEQV